MFSREERKLLRKRPANELTTDELWAAYEDWAMICLAKAVSKIGYANVEKTELIGDAYEVMVYSASKWKPGKANFQSFYKNMLQHRLYKVIWNDYGAFIPKPKAIGPKGSRGVRCVSIGAFEQEDVKGNGISRAHAVHMLGVITTTSREMTLGNTSPYELNPEQLVDAIRFARRAESRLSNLNKFVKTPGRKNLATRLRRIMVNGETAAEVAASEGLSTRAVEFSLREGRYLLQHLIGLPKASLKSAINNRVCKGWTRERAKEVNELPVKQRSSRKCSENTLAARQGESETMKASREKQRAIRNAAARERYHAEKKKRVNQ